MSKLPLIRIATYALLVACFFVANRLGYISVTLGQPQDTPKLSDQDFFHGGLAPAKELGFVDSKMSGAEVLRRARAFAQESQIDLSDYGPPKVSLQTVTGVLLWYLTFEATGPGNGFQIIRVVIEDATGRCYVERIEEKA